MRKITGWLGSVLWIYLYVNPLLDIASGAFIYVKYGDALDVFNDVDIGLTPSLVVRMAMLLLFALYILLLRDRKAIFVALPLGAAWALSLAAEYIGFGAVDLMADAQYFAKFCYNVAIILAYENLFRRSGLSRDALFDRLHRMLCIVSFILAAGVLIPYILHFGFYTYADRFGYRGFRGVYYSGNDITASFMLGMPITLCKFLTLDKAPFKTKLFYGAAPVLTLLCLLVIGTKTAFAAILIAVLFILVYGLVRRRKDRADKSLVMLLFVFGGLVLSALLLSLLARQSVLQTIAASFLGFGDAAEESTRTLLLSGRQDLLGKTFRDFIHYGPVAWLFGLGRGSRENIIEMDLFEVVFYYGAAGAAAMLWFYFKRGIGFVRDFFKRFTLQGMGAFIALGTCVAYLTMAGHVLFSVTSGFFFAFVLLYGTLTYRYDDPPAREKPPSR